MLTPVWQRWRSSCATNHAAVADALSAVAQKMVLSRRGRTNLPRHTP